jgi:hypothetical protein
MPNMPGMPNIWDHVPESFPYFDPVQFFPVAKGYVVHSVIYVGQTVLNDPVTSYIVGRLRDKDPTVISEICEALIKCLSNLKEPCELSFGTIQDPTTLQFKFYFYPVVSKCQKIYKTCNNLVNTGDESKSMGIILGSTLFRDKFIELIADNSEAKRGFTNMLIGHSRNQHSEVVPILQEIAIKLMQ